MLKYTQAQVRLNRTCITDKGLVRREVTVWFPQGLYWANRDRIAALAKAARKAAGSRPRLQLK